MVGAGAGLSASAGLTYSGERFERYFGDFQARYGIRDMYAGGFYPFETLEEYWAWWSRHIWYNRYVDPPKPVYRDLLDLVGERDYFVLTTNVDHQFQRAGFDAEVGTGIVQYIRPEIIGLVLGSVGIIGDGGFLIKPLVAAAAA